MMKMRVLWVVLGAGLPSIGLAAPALPALGSDSSAVTVSGISSGGYMAVQFQVAYSKLVKGAGIIAAGPYDCAEGSAVRALSNCMAPTRWAPPPAPGDVKARMESRARLDLIDPPAALADDKVWVLTGGADHTVERPVVDALVGFYKAWVPAESIRLVTLPDAGHAMISVADSKPNACDTSEPPYINRCGDFDAPGELLGHLLGKLKPKSVPEPGHLVTFDQRPFTGGLPADISMDEQGFAYIPASCRAGGCRVHVAFHGCRQGEDQVGRRFVELLDEGVLDHVIGRVADARDIGSRAVEHGSQLSLSMAGLPQIMARSTAGSRGGRPMSSKSLPLSIRSVRRPWLRKGSRVTVG
jgi:hypothetical protein